MLQTNQFIKKPFLIKSVWNGDTGKGEPYSKCELICNEGSIYGIRFGSKNFFSDNDVGKVFIIEGNVTNYYSTRQIIIDNMRVADECEYQIEDISNIDMSVIMSRITYIEKMLRGIEDDDFRNVCFRIYSNYKNKFTIAPAAKCVHHDRPYGLLIHTTEVMFLSYCATKLLGANMSLVIAASFLHDLGKAEEINYSAFGYPENYSLEGELIGHVEIICLEISKVCRELNVPSKKELALIHVIKSSSSIDRKMIEAEILHCADALSAVADVYHKNVKKGWLTSKKIYPLGRKLFSI